jgi:DNA mismatch endonuclease (patch repair protein)
MADIWGKRKRSEVMSRIRSKGNESTEMMMISVFRRHGVTGWRRGQALPGKPDFTFRKERLCVFADGCFWHGCPKCYREPGSNNAYWAAKVERNRARDKRVARELRREGWRVLRVWEHELAGKRLAALLGRLRRAGLSPKALENGGG